MILSDILKKFLTAVNSDIQLSTHPFWLRGLDSNQQP
jgi:hypothetical protein